MKKVKFNITSSVHMIPDERYPSFKEEMAKMKFSSFKDYQQRLLAGTEFEMRDVKIGDIVDVPDWYFEAHQHDEMQVGVSVDNYRFKNDNKLRPFDAHDAVMHGHIDDAGTLMKTVKRFELVEDLTIHNKPKDNQQRISK